MKRIVWATHRGHIGGKEYCWKVPDDFLPEIVPGDVLIAQTSLGEKSIFVTRVCEVKEYPDKICPIIKKNGSAHVTQKRAEQVLEKKKKRKDMQTELIKEAFGIRGEISEIEKRYLERYRYRWFVGYQLGRKTIENKIRQSLQECNNMIDFEYADKLMHETVKKSTEDRRR